MSERRDEQAGESAEEGFTLAEVLVAFAILALVTLAMMRAFSGTSLALSRSAGHEARMDLAARIIETERARDPMEPGRREGRENGLDWWALTEPVESAGLAPPAGTPRLFRLSVGVDPHGAKPASALLSTLILARGSDGR
ncbi:PulJ/GspJ family protein [Aureimonas ureilytica]|uniref:PulJ/GspJ family protein n=1 Tax=Aureimonas ureilytica TaxID=401562 RepID=UPI00036EB60E|nr:prepilin-type N-terminal cleavage/methylation domain-containing protein [Aureimonas ureilytica]